MADPTARAIALKALSIGMFGVPGPKGDKGEPGAAGSGVLYFETLAALQAAYPNGTTVPVWVVADNSWYYWDTGSTPPPDTLPPVITASPPGGTFTAAQTVTLTSNEPATIYYTTDGSEPSINSATYSTSIAIDANKTLKYLGKDTAGNVSAVQTQVYTINIAPATTYYLAMNGTNNGLRVPVITLTEVVLDCYVEHKTASVQSYINVANGAPFGSFKRDATEKDTWATDFTAVYIDGVLATNNTTFVPSNKRIVIRAVLKAEFTDDPTLFANTIASSDFVKGRIYDAKFYNGATLEAHYNMSTQSLVDQSGNGKTATMNGTATWVAEG